MRIKPNVGNKLSYPLSSLNDNQGIKIFSLELNHLLSINIHKKVLYKFFEIDFVIKINAISGQCFDRSMVIFKFGRRINLKMVNGRNFVRL